MENNQVAEFVRTVRNAESQLRNRKNLTGRNAHGSQSAMDYKMCRLTTLARTSDAVCAALDADAKLAARWNRLERAHAGLPA
jgi:hypothetical protein